MARRGSSLNQIDSGLSREINSNFDNVKKVADNISAVVTVAGTDLGALTAALVEATDFSGITVVSGPVSGWDPVGKVLTVETVQGEQGVQGIPGVQGPQGLQGPQGVKGTKGDTGPQGVQGLTGKDGKTGPAGAAGPAGLDGLNLTVDQIVYNGDGTFTWDFSDGTTYTTPDLTGPAGIDGTQGVKGDQGVSVHHLKGTNTTDPEGDFGSFGEYDTYTFYGDAAETLNLGYFTIRNGLSPEQMAQEGYMLRSTYDLNGDGVVDNSEALGGKSLVQVEQERDDAILAAQLALGTNYTVADNPARLALTDLTAGDKVFVADDGDGKWAQYWVTAVVDGLGFTSTFEVVMDEDTYLNANTKEGVKATYESNPDTNAFTDAEKTSVDVATGLTTTASTLPSAINELHSDIGDLLLDTTATNLTDAVNEHEADIGSMLLDTTAQNITGAVNEVHTELDSHIADSVDAHDASAISYDNVASGIAATEVQGALDEIESSLETHVTSDGSDHTFIDQDVTTTGTPSFNSVQFNGGVGSQGVVNWNPDEETLDLVTGSDTVLQVGEEHVVSVINQTGVVIPNGVPVMYVGTVGASGKVAIDLVDGSSPLGGELLVGVTTSTIANGATGKVTKFGKVRGLDTTGTPYGEVWSTGDILYVSPTTLGAFTNVKPTGPNAVTPVAAVVNVHASTGTIIVRAIPVNYNRIASDIYVAPTGNLASDNVQSALNELQTSIDQIILDVEW